jgi:lactate dehydrogenase-like 2-hydroxyacid dehydrogenase
MVSTSISGPDLSLNVKSSPLRSLHFAAKFNHQTFSSLIISNGNKRYQWKKKFHPSTKPSGKTVIISVGLGGIGYEVARGLADAGANVRLLHAHP